MSFDLIRFVPKLTPALKEYMFSELLCERLDISEDSKKARKSRLKKAVRSLFLNALRKLLRFVLVVRLDEQLFQYFEAKLDLEDTARPSDVASKLGISLDLAEELELKLGKILDALE